MCARDVAALYGYWRIRDRAIPDVTRLGKLGMALMMAGLTWLLLLPDADVAAVALRSGPAAERAWCSLQYVRRYGSLLDPPAAALDRAGARTRTGCRRRGLV